MKRSPLQMELFTTETCTYRKRPQRVNFNEGGVYIRQEDGSGLCYVCAAGQETNRRHGVDTGVIAFTNVIKSLCNTTIKGIVDQLTAGN